MKITYDEYCRIYNECLNRTRNLRENRDIVFNRIFDAKVKAANRRAPERK